MTTKTKKDSKKESYDFKSSPIYKCHSVKYLCKVLQIQRHELKYILKQKEEQFVKFERKEPLDNKDYEEIECFKNSVLIKSIRKHKTKDKIRTMIYPRKNTNYEKLNKRICDVLTRIIKPEYNFMRRKNEHKNFSHLDYVKAHLSNKYYTLTMDISNFYPSITSEKIYNFFKNDMKCCKKVATILSKLTTAKTEEDKEASLPQGFCFSPVLSWLVCRKQFNKLYNYCQQNNVIFTNWIDDIAFSCKDKEKLEKIEKIVKNKLEKISQEIKNEKTKFFSKNDKEIMNIIIKHGKAMTLSESENYRRMVRRMNR